MSRELTRSSDPARWDRLPFDPAQAIPIPNKARATLERLLRDDEQAFSERAEAEALLEKLQAGS